MRVWQACLLLAVAVVCSEATSSPSDVEVETGPPSDSRVHTASVSAEYTRFHFGSFNINKQKWGSTDVQQDVAKWVFGAGYPVPDEPVDDEIETTNEFSREDVTEELERVVGVGGSHLDPSPSQVTTGDANEIESITTELTEDVTSTTVPVPGKSFRAWTKALNADKQVVVMGFQEAGELVNLDFTKYMMGEGKPFSVNGYTDATPPRHPKSNLKTYVLVKKGSELQVPGKPLWAEGKKNIKNRVIEKLGHMDMFPDAEYSYDPAAKVQVLRLKEGTSRTENGKGALFTRFKVGGITVVVVNVHLSSGSANAKTEKRIHQMKLLNEALLHMFGPQEKNEVRIWLGDFNDRPIGKEDDNKAMAEFSSGHPSESDEVSKAQYIKESWEFFMSEKGKRELFLSGDHGARAVGLHPIKGDMKRKPALLSGEYSEPPKLNGYPTYKRFRPRELGKTKQPKEPGVTFKVGQHKTIFSTKENGPMFVMQDSKVTMLKKAKKSMGKTDDHWFPGYLDRVVHRLGFGIKKNDENELYDVQNLVLSSDHAPVTWAVDMKVVTWKGPPPLVRSGKSNTFRRAISSRFSAVASAVSSRRGVWTRLKPKKVAPVVPKGAVVPEPEDA